MKGEGGQPPADADSEGILKRLHPEYIAIAVLFVLLWLNAFGVFS